MQPYAQYRRLIRERAGVKETDAAETVRTKIADLMRAIALPGWEGESERVARALLGVELPDEPPLEGEEFQRQATELVVGSTVAQGGRRLIVFEDLHWCDHASLDLVRATTELVVDAPIVVLISFRPDREAVSWGLRGWVEAELAEHAIVLDLEPLSAGESDELIDAFLPVPGMTDEDRRRILGKTEGNPLFLQEVARALIDGGLVERANGGWRLTGDAAEIAIPDTIQSLITVGLDRLPGTARGTVQTAAVIGRTFAEELLVAVVGRPEVREDLHELQRRDLIRVVGGRRTGRVHVPSRPHAGSGLRHAPGEAPEGHPPAGRRGDRSDRGGSSGGGRATARPALLGSGRGRADPHVRRDGRRRRGATHANAEAEAHYRIGAGRGTSHRGAARRSCASMYERRGSALELLGRYDDAIANYEEMHDEARDARGRGDGARGATR